MKIKHRSRLARIDKAIRLLPLHASTVEDALEHFRQTGELPEQPRLADAVTKKVLDPDWNTEDEPNAFARYLRAALARDEIAPGASTPAGAQNPRPSTALKTLYSEAVWGPEPVREIARKALLWYADDGTDVASIEWLADRKRPAFGTVGMMLLGYPDFLVVPPYEEQAQRLFVRYGELLEKKGPCDEHFERRFLRASVAFYRHGDLPTDPLMRDIVLGSTELDALFGHRRGVDVAELMEALDQAALAGEDDREAAIGRVTDVVLRMGVEIVGRIP